MKHDDIIVNMRTARNMTGIMGFIIIILVLHYWFHIIIKRINDGGYQDCHGADNHHHNGNHTVESVCMVPSFA